MKTQNIIQPLRNHLKPLALAVTAGVLLMSHTPAVADITLTDTGTVWWANSSNATIINSFTANASANVLVVSVSLRTTVQLNSGNAPVVTYDGVPLTVAASALGFNANYISTGIYYMFNPPTASAKDLTVSFPAGGNLSYAVDAYTLGGVDTSKQPELFPGWTATTLAVSGSNPTSVSVTLSNLISGSWVASSAGFRNTNSTNSFSSSVTSGSFGVLNTSGPVGPIGFISTGNLWAQRTSDTIGAGALVENVTSPSVTVEHTGGAVGALFNVAGVAFAPLVGPGYTISGTISTYDAPTGLPDGALVELKVGGIVHAQKTVPSGGAYSFTVPVGTYTIRASKSPYLPIESSAISITTANVTQDLTLPQDTISPVWASGWPKATDVGSTGFSARVTTDEIGTAYYVVVANNDPAPTSAQVEAGQNNSGGAALKSGSISITAANTEFSAAVTGLAQISFFDVYFVAKDAAGNLQLLPVKVDIATLQNLYTESFVGGTHNQQLSLSPVGWEANYIVQIQIASATPDGDNTYASKWATESGRMPVSTKVGEYTITAASRIGTTFTVDFAANQTNGMRFFAWVGGVRYGSDKFANVDATNGQMGSGSAVTTWATKSYSVESSNWYLMPSDIDELISTTPVPLPPGDITQFGVYWNNQGNGQQWAIDNFRVDATPASGTYAWDGGAGNWANSNWTFGGVPSQAPATGFHMFINGGGTVAVADDFLSALTVNVGQNAIAGSLTVNNTKTLGASQLSLGSNGTLQVDGTLTAPAVISNGTAAITSTGVVNASSLVQIVAGSLTSAGGSQLNIGTGTLMLSGGTGATLDGLLSINGGTVNLTSGTLTYNNASPASPAVLVFNGGALAGTGSVVPTNRYEVYNLTLNNNLSGATTSLVAASGTVVLTGTNTYGGDTEIRVAASAVTLRVADASNIPMTGNLYMNSPGRFQSDANGRPPILETKGTLERNIGTGAGKIRFALAESEKSSVCFAAYGGPLSVQLNTGAPITLDWSNTSTGLNNMWLKFGSANADNVVTFKNGLNMSTADREIEVVDNPGSPNDSAVIQGGITNDATARKLTKSGNGTLTLKGVNTYTGSTTVSSGTLILDVGAQLKFVIPATSGGNKTITGAGTVVLNGDFYIDTATNTDGAAITTGTWQLENVASLTTAYGTSFRVVDSGGNPWSVSGDQWTKIVGSKLYTFDETNGTLALSVAPTTGYAVWANANGVSLIPSEDSNNDGVANGVAYFMNKTGLATNPAINGTTKKVTWPNGGKIDSDQYGIQFVVQTSSDLQTWTNVPATGDPNLINTSAIVSPPSDGELSYTLTGASPRFVRLKVTPN